MEAILFPLLALGLAGGALYWTVDRSQKILQSWAKSSGYSIVSAQFCWFRRGPFFWRSSQNQMVFHVTAIDGAGKRRRGWVRCGSFWLGVLRDEATVEWES